MADKPIKIEGAVPAGTGVIPLLEDILVELKLNNKLTMELIPETKKDPTPKVIPMQKSSSAEPKKSRTRAKKSE